VDPIRIALIVGAVFTGLFTGLMLTFQIVIQRLLNRMEAPAYTATMKQLIQAADNPPVVPGIVILAMLGPLVALVLLREHSGSLTFMLTAIALGLFVVFSFLVTMVLNVPINNAIAKEWRVEQPPANWQTMRNRWNNMNWYRTPSSAIAFILLLVTLTLPLP
jgi:uncharacterized membrane protein